LSLTQKTLLTALGDSCSGETIKANPITKNRIQFVAHLGNKHRATSQLLPVYPISHGIPALVWQVFWHLMHVIRQTIRQKDAPGLFRTLAADDE